MEKDLIRQLSKELESELTNNILPYWMNKMVDKQNGGFYGQITGEEQLVEKALKGGILNARILWTFSAAYKTFKVKEYLKSASRAKNYIIDHFFDKTYGGTYWSLDCKGEPSDTKKQIYSVAFFIYALSEYFAATGDKLCLDKAIDLFHLIEVRSLDKNLNGYFEAYSQDWKLLDDLRLSDKDANEKKTMNTHLHILEAYTNLSRVWENDFLKKQLENLVLIFFEKILDNKTYHLNLFFDENWERKSSVTSYGHDIEASWLLLEAANVLDNKILIKRAREITRLMATANLEGLQSDGSIIYEKNNVTGHINYDRDWWVQAEAVVGYLNAWEVTGNEKYLDISVGCWKYIKEKLIDPQNGEWFWGIKRDGSINRTDDKAGFWKCPYHNSRTCLEIMHRYKSLA
jgi:mannobiose 2-epimerase